MAEIDSKPGLSVFKYCVFLIKMAIDSGMELYRVRLESEEPLWLDDRGGGGHNGGTKGDEGIKQISRLVSLTDKGI